MLTLPAFYIAFGVVKFAHLINPLVVTNPASDLNVAQPITLASMQRARQVALADPRIDDVVQLCACYAEDLPAVAEGFVTAPLLERSILDVVDARPGEKQRKLPILADLLQRLHDGATDADYLVYTNIDIGLQPDFYTHIAELIDNQGFTALTVPRVTVAETYTSPEQLDAILQLPGQPHYGFNCFVFARRDLQKYILGDTCIGIQPVSITLVINMMVHAQRYTNYKDKPLTFHIGDDRVWNRTLLDSYHQFNELQLDQVVREIQQHHRLDDWPASVLRSYLRMRSNWVIEQTDNNLYKLCLRLARKLGLLKWTAGQY